MSWFGSILHLPGVEGVAKHFFNEPGEDMAPEDRATQDQIQRVLDTDPDLVAAKKRGAGADELENLLRAKLPQQFANWRLRESDSTSSGFRPTQMISKTRAAAYTAAGVGGGVGAAFAIPAIAGAGGAGAAGGGSVASLGPTSAGSMAATSAGLSGGSLAAGAGGGAAAGGGGAYGSLIGRGISGGLSAYQAYEGSQAAQTASQQLQDANREALALQSRIYDTSRADYLDNRAYTRQQITGLAPYQQIGSGSLANLARLTGNQTPMGAGAPGIAGQPPPSAVQSAPQGPPGSVGAPNGYSVSGLVNPQVMQGYQGGQGPVAPLPDGSTPTGATVQMKAPDGTIKAVSPDQVAHFSQLGAVRLG